MLFRSLIKFLRSTLFSSFRSGPKVKVDRLRIPNNIIKPDVSEKECLAHLYLLEAFVFIREHVERQAGVSNIDPESAWKFYINTAVGRMTKWFETMYEQNIKMIVPPLDVLMVWHAFLQSPEEWDRFVRLTRLDFGGWDVNALLCSFEKSDYGTLKMSTATMDVAEDLYEALDALDLVDMSAAFMTTSRPDRTTEHLAHLFLHKDKSFKMRTMSGAIKFRFDFHAAVRDQLAFANRILEHSWHRMYPPIDDPNRRQLQWATERYTKFINLVRFKSRLERTGPLFNSPNTAYLPALDIDLVWRTHMLFPERYRQFSSRVSNALIPHTGCPVSRESDSDYEMMGKLYRRVFDEAYDICRCWYCVFDRENPAPIYRSKPDPGMLEERIERETHRRVATAIPVAFKFGEKQCRNCGSHPHKFCKAKDIIRPAAARPVETAFESPQIPHTSTTGKEPLVIPPPQSCGLNETPGRSSPTGVPHLRNGSPFPPTPGQQQPRSMTGPRSLEFTPWMSQLSVHSTCSKATTQTGASSSSCSLNGDNENYEVVNSVGRACGGGTRNGQHDLWNTPPVRIDPGAWLAGFQPPSSGSAKRDGKRPMRVRGERRFIID